MSFWAAEPPVGQFASCKTWSPTPLFAGEFSSFPPCLYGAFGTASGFIYGCFTCWHLCRVRTIPQVGKAQPGQGQSNCVFFPLLYQAKAAKWILCHFMRSACTATTLLPIIDLQISAGAPTPDPPCQRPTTHQIPLQVATLPGCVQEHIHLR